MDDNKNSIADYCGAPNNYYWQWGDNGEVIEYGRDLTVCYTDELISILKEMSDQGWPPLGSILLVLIACKEDGKHIVPLKYSFDNFLRSLRGEDGTFYLEVQAHIQQTIQLLNVIAALPADYRSGTKRNLLLKTIFTDIPPVISSAKAHTLLHFFYKDTFVNKQNAYTQLIAELTPLSTIAQQITDADTLELQLRTSLEVIPEPLPLPLTDLQEPDLFTQLEADSKTAGISRMAKRILATLRIPVHTQHSNDQSLGGISDISNKGSYDRLLISELAQDDHVLMARVANNEALYFRREALSVQPEKDRVILVDASLKMWGIPRVFAISAALACIQYDERHTNVIAYTLQGSTAKRADLSSKKGVINALSVLDSHLHSGVALEAVLQNEEPGQSTCYLITAEELMQQPEFLQTVVRLQTKLSYLVTVNRNGQFRLYQYSRGQKKLCNAALLNPEELLFNPVTKATRTNVSMPECLPEILGKQPLPLRYPASRLKRQINNNAVLSPQQVVCITTDQRILYWPEKSKGAIELCSFIEKGDYCFGSDDPGRILLVVNDPGREHIFLHIFPTTDANYTMYNTHLRTADCKIIYLDKHFHIQHPAGQHAICGATGEAGTPLSMADFDRHYLAHALTGQQNLNNVFRFINKGYNTLSKITGIYVTDSGRLIIGNRRLDIDHYNRLKLSANPVEIDYEKSKANVSSTFVHPANPNILFTQFKCFGEITAIADSRGFLHLQTDDKTLPEITMTLVTDVLITCWASDNTCYGNPYFIHDPAANIMEGEPFYNDYIQPYIERLKWK